MVAEHLVLEPEGIEGQQYRRHGRALAALIIQHAGAARHSAAGDERRQGCCCCCAAHVKCWGFRQTNVCCAGGALRLGGASKNQGR